MGMTSVVRFVMWIGVVFVVPAATFAQPSGQRPQAQAVRVEADAVRVDGTLGDAGWNLATPVTNFTQREPSEGEPARDRMEVRFLYDDGALYVLSLIHISEPKRLRRIA